ncbi:MAG TPA: TSUP family transporter, partial [Polyangia bacterium]|nr:TSUP family transporter [Polyangia bacterium]
MHLGLGFFLSTVIGLSLGLLGGGGSIITVPVLTYVMGVPAHQAVGMSLAVVGLTSTVGALVQRRGGNVRLGTGLLFGGVGLGGSYFGTRLTYLLPPHTLLLLFAALM